MRKTLIGLSFLMSFGANASFLEIRSDEFEPKNLKDKKWRLDLGLDYMQYPTTLPEYNGTHANVKSEENSDVFGIGLNIGREFSIGAGVSTTLKIGGFYNKTLDKSVGKASKDIDMDLANVRTDHMVYGTEASVSLNYLVENSILNFQPFIEFGMGTGNAEIEKQYSFEGIESDRSDAENYNAQVQEGFDYGKASVGVNFISQKGIISYIKATKLSMNVKEREVAGVADSTSLDKKEKDLNEAKDVMSASLGLGFLF
ncbi:MAG: hypothetical protein KC478_04665 [Bacteriovoracaceae bacterium]|nr:hypothetical protein [Bacteriovoracaceae bacterium]